MILYVFRSHVTNPTLSIILVTWSCMCSGHPTYIILLYWVYKAILCRGNPYTSPIIAWKFCQIWKVWECSLCCLIILNFYWDPAQHPVDIGSCLLSLFFIGSFDFEFPQIRNSLYNAKLNEIFSESLITRRSILQSCMLA